jgi:hypothetical protein
MRIRAVKAWFCPTSLKRGSGTDSEVDDLEIRQPDRSGDAGRPVALETRPHPGSSTELCPSAFLYSGQGEFDLHGSSGYRSSKSRRQLSIHRFAMPFCQGLWNDRSSVVRVTQKHMPPPLKNEGAVLK